MSLFTSKVRGLHALMAVLATSATAMTAAEAAVVTFNDLGPSPFGIRMPNAYGGLRWGGAGLSDWHYMTSGSDPTDNFLALSGTGTFVGAPLGGADFYFEGADFWSRRGLDANGDFYFILYHDGATVFNGLNEDGGRQRFSNVHQTFSPGYTGPVDGFALYFDNDDWDHLAMDNFRFTPVPTPGVLAGVVALGVPASGRRRRKSV